VTPEIRRAANYRIASKPHFDIHGWLITTLTKEYPMNIESGLLSGQVLQRNAKNMGAARISGALGGGGTVEARILKGAKPLKGWNWRPVGMAASGRFQALLDRIPAGGPYTVELRAVGSARPVEKETVREIYVGDVWFMAGQSNMQGIGNMNRAPKPHPQVRCFFMRDEWGLALDPLHLLEEAVDAVHNNGQPLSPAQAEHLRRKAVKGVGLGVFFGNEMVRRTGVPQGLVACAHGGTSMAQWSPDLKDQGGKSLYGALLRRFKKLGQPVRGILWYQGESDANAEAVRVYTPKMKQLVAATRADFGQPNLPWITVQIGRVISEGWSCACWNAIQDQQRGLVDQIKNLEVVPAIDLELDDGIHISSDGLRILGGRMARLADRLALGNRKEAGSIRLGTIRVRARTSPKDPRAQWFEVRFKNVVGGLRSSGLPRGFAILDSTGKPMGMVYKTQVEGDKVTLEANQSPSLAFGFAYGYGLDPTCTITDERGMGLPMFGPIPAAGQTGSAFLVKWEISGPLADRAVANAALPEDGLTWRAPHSVATTLVMPQDVNAPQAGLFYLRTAVEVAVAGTYKISMGADSPYRIWVNGRETAVNLTATNPCMPDQFGHPVELRVGRNEIRVAFDGRMGRGWGLNLRFFSMIKGENLSLETIVESATPNRST
jgi:sialate O-acetylesterase